MAAERDREHCWVELFGTARLAAERSVVPLPVSGATSLGAVARALAAACPALVGRALLPDGALNEGFVWNLNGLRFVSDPTTPVEPGDHLLLLSSAAGGADE